MESSTVAFSVDRIVDAIGVTALARRLGHKNASTVSSWKIRGSIPVAYWPRVIEAAREQGDTTVTLEALAAACGGYSAPAAPPEQVAQ